MNIVVNNLLTPQAVNYCWRQLAIRAGFSEFSENNITGFEALNISVYYGECDYEKNANAKRVIVLPASHVSWDNLLTFNNDAVDWISTKELLPPETKLKLMNTTPVILRGQNLSLNPVFLNKTNTTIVFNIDIISITFFMLTRWEESQKSKMDRHGRFLGSESVAYRLGFLNRPIVDEYAQILKEWVLKISPNVNVKNNAFQIKLSHDVDYIKKHSSVFKVIKNTAKKISSRGTLGEFFEPLSSYINHNNDVYYKGIFKLAELSETFGFISAFYFMTADPSQFDNGYWRNSKLSKLIIKELTLRGHEIGLHPGHTTFGNIDLLLKQKKRLEEVINIDFFGGRQHNLRFKAPDTWEHWEEAGMLYDATVGYADTPGFRCGTSYKYRPFNYKLNREMSIWEEPLIVMDVTLKRYLQLNPMNAKTIILDLAEKCKMVGGGFTLLWHNSSLDGEWAEWGEMYSAVLRELSRLIQS